MTLRSVMQSEGRLIWRERWIIGLTVLLVALSLWAGPVGTFRYAVGQLNRIEELRAVYQDEFNDFVLDDQVTADLRETILLLHPDIGVNYLLAILAVLGTMVLPIWGAQLVGQEFRNRTAKVRAAHAGWPRVILAKMAWLLVLSIALALLFTLVGSVSGQVTWRAAQQSLWLAEEVVPPELTVSAVRQILAAVMGLFLHGLIGLLFALVARSAMAGALVGLVLPYVEAMVIGVPAWGWALPRIAYGNLMVGNFMYFSGGFVSEPMALVPPPQPWLSWAVVPAWIVVIGALVWYASRRQEIFS